MSNPQSFKIPRLGDRSIVDCFKQLEKKHSGFSISVRIVPSVNFTIPSFQDANHPALEAALAQNAAIIDHVAMTLEGLTIQFFRGGSKEEKSAVFDELVFYTNDNNPHNPPVEVRIEIVADLCKKLKAFDPKRTLGTASTPEAKQLEALHETTLTRLELLAEDVIRKASETRESLELQYSNKVLLSETQTTHKKEQLEAQYLEELNKLEGRERDLELKLKAIDDRGNTHARREIREKMLNDVKARIETFGVSSSTSQKRSPVARGFLALIGLLCFLVIGTGYEINSYHEDVRNGLYYEPSKASVQRDPEDKLAAMTKLQIKTDDRTIDRNTLYLLWARISLLTFGLVFSILYYIRWQNRWAEQHANSEFQLQQFYIDVNRANWAIESGLEWRKETNSDMPDALLTNVTKNLFNSNLEPEVVLHPADELASALVGSASKVNLKVGDNEILFDNPKKIPKTVSKKDDA